MANSLAAWNDGKPTHAANNVIDLVLGPKEVSMYARTDTDVICGSDHRSVHTVMQGHVQVDCSIILGRIAWDSNADLSPALRDFLGPLNG